MEKIFEHTLGKEKAYNLCKKTLFDKLPIISTSVPIKFGTPPLMTGSIEITDTTISIKTSPVANHLGNLAAIEIEKALDDLKEPDVNQNDNQTKTIPSESKVNTESKNNTSNNLKPLTHEQYLAYQREAIALLREYKTLVNEDVITQKDFDKKKEDILNFIDGMMLNRHR